MSSSKMMKKNIENELSTKNAKGFEYSFVNNISESRQLFSEGKDRRNGSLLSMINNIEVRKNPRDARN
jgi:hypothetical protein